MKSNVLVFLLFLILVPLTGVLGLSPYKPKVINPLTQSWRWKQFPELEGHGVRDIFEGKNKSVWVAYNEGVYEYDGYTWRTHNADNGLVTAPMDRIFVDDKGYVYAAGNQGIFKYNGVVWTPIFQAPSNYPFAFTDIKMLGEDVLVATSNRGLLIITDEVKLVTSSIRKNNMASSLVNTKVITFPNELLPEEDFMDLSDILQDQYGTIWLAFTMPNEQGRILKFDKENLDSDYIENYSIVTSNKEIKLGESQQLLEARDGVIWVVNSTYKTGISIFENGKWSYIKMNDIFSGDEYMTEIMESDDGTIWIGSLGKLYTYKDKKWSIYTAPHFPIPANQVLLQRSAGNYIWLAGNKSKVYYLDFSHDKWISYENLNFQFQNINGEEWFLEYNGSVVFEKTGKWYSYGTEDGLMDAPIRVIQTKSGQIWAAGSHNGVASTAYLEGDRWVRVLHPQLSWGIDYRAVFEDKDGALWFGAAVDAEVEKGQKSGLLKLEDPIANPKEYIHLPGNENGLNQSNVYGIGQSADGRIWIGGGSLYSYNGEEWQQPLDSRLTQFVNVAYSNDGFFLAGSRYYGIFTFDGKQWGHFDKSNGLAGNTIISIDAISPEAIYVATDNDICRFDGRSWVKNVFPSELNMEFEGGQLLHDNNGALWINKSSRSWKRRAFTHNKTNNNQLAEFVAHKYIPDVHPPETIITMFSDEVSQEGNTLIQWDGHDFYAQSSGDELMYSHKLGAGEWSPFSYDNHHTFMSLPNGEYTLQIRARDLDLNIDPTPAILNFKVLPPVWKQLWFILLMLTFMTVLGIYEFRIITKKRKLEVLNASLQKVNQKLKLKGKKIQIQNDEILKQQEYNLKQAKALELINKNLEDRNDEIRSQKEKLEDMLIQIEDLSRAKLGFFTNISHELRTPLTLISGPIRKLIDQEGETDHETRTKLYKVIERNSDRLLKLINQLLEMRKIENSNLDLKFKMVNVSYYLSEIVSLYENLAVERDIIFGFESSLNNQPFNIDPDKVEKILVNLISNAFKHTPNGGSIKVNLSRQNSVDNNLPVIYDEYLEIQVRDTGSGIQQEDLEHIYERFFATNGFNSEVNSTGIGLAYIKELISAMQGEIRVSSKVGSGTTFSVYLPCIQVGKEEPAFDKDSGLKMARKEADLLLNSFVLENELKSALNKDGNIEKKKILLVEDHHDMLIYLETILGDQYDIIKAVDGVEGLEKASAFSIDLIVSDVMMPNMDGLEFCEKIKSDLTTSHIPVILLTAKVLEKNRIEGYEHGADGYIEKPFNPGLLMARIENILEQREILKSSFNRDFILSPQKIKLTSPDEELLNRIVEIMEENIENSDFNVNQMCKMVHLSHMHFIRKVKQLTGKKPIDLLKSFRLKRAKDLLMQKDISISEIAYKVGYDLPNSFSRAFKKEFGYSPKEFVFRDKAGMN